MRVKGKTSGKWQPCEIIKAHGGYRFRVTGACGERQFDLTFEQLRSCITQVDCETPYEYSIWKYFWRDVDTSVQNA